MFGLSIIDKILGIGKTAADRLIPDKNKAQADAHEERDKQIDATTEGEKSRNYYTPRAIILYAMAFSVVYGVVVQPFLKAFGLNAPVVDYAAPLRILLGLLGLDLAG
jgi:uncharacterized membrane protein